MNYSFLSTYSKTKPKIETPQNVIFQSLKTNTNKLSNQIPTSLLTYVHPKSVSESSYQHPDLRVIVLTYNRAESLNRLLNSLNNAIYLNHKVDIDIFIDKPSDGKINFDVVQTSEDFNWKHGKKAVHQREKNAGLRKQWIHTWNESIFLSSSGQEELRKDTKEICLILEDDLSVSPFFYIYFKTMHKKYYFQKNIAGITLQRGNLCANNCPELQGGPISSGSFRYNLVGSWGYSPFARHWINFIDFVNNFDEQKVSPVVLDLKPSQWYKKFTAKGRCPGANCMWTMLHLKYTATHVDRFTIYAKAGEKKTLATNHQEVGLHFQKKGKQDFPILEKWDQSLFKEFVDRDGEYKLIPNLKSITWDGTIFSVENEIVLEAQRIANEFGFVILQFLNGAFLEMTQHWICNMKQLDQVEEKNMFRILEKTLFIATDEIAFQGLSKFAADTQTVLNFVFDPFDKGAKEENVYGQVGYYLFINWRGHVLSSLLENNIPFLLAESDAVWLKNPLPEIVGEHYFFSGYNIDPDMEKYSFSEVQHYDYIFFDDKPEEKIPQGGFIFFNPAFGSKEFFKRIVKNMDNMKQKFEKKSVKQDIKELGNEQYTWNKLVKEEENL
eukprot:snap_masked-scaffold_8-processed-gene-10.46-mRNA-1 protein AED:1.00 eAED:1.00 QI:0/-1/0/0/-1/1/1/0/609